MDQLTQARQRARAAYEHARKIDPLTVPHAQVALETLGELGRGGMGIVHRVRDRRLGREAALKLMHPEMLEDPGAIKRFLREAKLTGGLDHPCVPPVFEAGTTASGQPFMLLQVIEGDPLDEQIRVFQKRGGEQRLKQLAEVVVKIGETIAYAHSQGLVHRDLKPANAMVGAFGEVMVLDWGLAKYWEKAEETEGVLAVSSQGGDPELTVAGQAVGTPGYMSPEQAGGEAVGSPADVFALGAILHAVLTGKPPVEGATAINRITNTLKGEISRPRDLNPDAPAELDALAAAALAPEAKDRPTAEEFVRELRAWLAGEELSVYRYSPLTRARRWAERHPTLLVALLLAAVGLGVGGTVVSALAERTRRAELQKARVAAERERAEQHADAIASALALLAKARNEAQLGNGAAVPKTLEKALAELPPRDASSPAFLLSFAQIYWSAGLLDRAVPILRELAASEAGEDAMVAEALFALHRIDTRDAPIGSFPASEHLDALIERARLQPEHPYVLLAQADRAAGKEDARRVEQLAASVLDDNPRLAWAWYLRGWAKARQKSWREGERALDKAIALDPSNMSAYLLRGEVRMKRTPPPNALGAYDDVSVALASLGNLAEAPKAPEARRSLARIYLIRGRSQLSGAGNGEVGGLEDLARVVDMDPGHLEARLLAAERRVFAARTLIEKVKQPYLAAAKADFDWILERAPKHARALEGRVEVHSQYQAIEEAQRDARALIEAAPQRTAYAHYFVGQAYLNAGRPKEARAAFEQSVAADVEIAKTWFALGLARNRVGMVDEALAAYTQAVELARAAPRVGNLNLLLARALMYRAGIKSERDMDGALADYGAAIEAYPGDTQIYFGRGQLRAFGLEDYEGGLADFDKVIEINPSSAAAFRMRGMIKLLLRNAEGAKTDTSIAIRENSEDAEAYRIRAHAFSSLGQPREALSDIERFLELAPPSHPARASAMQLQAKLRAELGG